MTEGLHPAAPHHLPSYIAGPGETDTLFLIVTVLVIVTILGLGVMFFWLHSLPERMGHKKLQFEVVAVLGLLSLFTHIHAFWVAALLLALIDLPDFVTPVKRMAGALDKLAGIEPPPEDETQGSGGHHGTGTKAPKDAPVVTAAAPAAVSPAPLAAEGA